MLVICIWDWHLSHEITGPACQVAVNSLVLSGVLKIIIEAVNNHIVLMIAQFTKNKSGRSAPLPDISVYIDTEERYYCIH